MSRQTASLNTKIDEAVKARFVETANSLGMSASSAIKIFVAMFNDYGGFPFEVRHPERLTDEAEASYAELRAQMAAGTAKRYASFDEILAEVDAEIAAEDAEAARASGLVLAHA